MKTPLKLTIVLLVIISALGIGFSLTQKQSVKPSWVHEVTWQNKPGEAAEIEEQLWTEISPYRTEYKTVNITASSYGKGLHLRVIATAKDSEHTDIYDFTYEDNKILLTGYLLEAIPTHFRNEAIGIALANQEVATSVIGSGAPTVKRILPATAGKYYAQKTLLSVTWERTSALIDPDERKVVNIWKADTEE